MKAKLKGNEQLVKRFSKIADPGKRWASGTPHHKESMRLMKLIAELDFEFNNDYFQWKYGGDGDNGESLMYLMDMIFELDDRNK